MINKSAIFLVLILVLSSCTRQRMVVSQAKNLEMQMAVNKPHPLLNSYPSADTFMAAVNNHDKNTRQTKAPGAWAATQAKKVSGLAKKVGLRYKHSSHLVFNKVRTKIRAAEAQPDATDVKHAFSTISLVLFLAVIVALIILAIMALQGIGDTVAAANLAFIILGLFLLFLLAYIGKLIARICERMEDGEPFFKNMGLIALISFFLGIFFDSLSSLGGFFFAASIGDLLMIVGALLFYLSVLLFIIFIFYLAIQAMIDS